MMASSLLLAAAVALAPAAAPTVSEAEIACFVEQVKSCWTILPEDINSGLDVTLLIELDRNGAIAGSAIAEPLESEAGQRLARSAIRALEQFAPYSFSTDTYEQWKQLKITLQP